MPPPDPLAGARCRDPGNNPAWWDADAPTIDRLTAVAVCLTCPAARACADRAAELGPAASGVWAGRYRPWAGQSDEDTVAFTEVFGQAESLVAEAQSMHGQLLIDFDTMTVTARREVG